MGNFLQGDLSEGFSRNEQFFGRNEPRTEPDIVTQQPCNGKYDISLLDSY